MSSEGPGDTGAGCLITAWLLRSSGGLLLLPQKGDSAKTLFHRMLKKWSLASFDCYFEVCVAL